MAVRIKKVLGIKGMTCTHCEQVIHKALMGIDGITEVQVNYRKGTATFLLDSERADAPKVYNAVEAAGYEVVPEGILSNAPKSFSPLQLAGVGILIAAVYLLIDRTIGFNFIPEISASMSYGMLFAVGLLTSLHCIAMCGGINLSQCISPQSEEGGSASWKPSLLYNGGRVISYTVIGGLVGALGSVISFSGGARGVVAILAGAFMVLMGINMLGLVPGLRRFTVLIPPGLRNRLMGGDGRRGPLVVGLLNGLMPCGPLQTMQLYALGTGSAAAGALSMLAFSLGTVPLMFGFGALSTVLSKRFTRNMLKVSAVLVLLLGAVMIQRGLSLGGSPALALPQTSQSDFSGALVAKIEDGYQVVTGDITSRAYPRIVVQKGTPVRFNLRAEAASLNGCNDAIVIPAFDIQKGLAPGDNIIEFTPDTVGEIGYACWMGMIRSSITVIDALPLDAVQEAPPAAEAYTPALLPSDN